MIKFYIVGGYVRDQILGVPSKDKDYAVEAPSYEAMRDHIAQNGKIWQERPQYFTVRAKLNNEDCDYVLCRKEGYYSDGRRPDSVEPGTIFDDLSRRDFTCNAIAIREDGSYYDPFNGQDDIRQRILRCVGNPRDRFTEDSLRLVRAVRFAITKDMDLDPSIEKCLYDRDLLALLNNVSVERIREEMYKCFAANTPQTIYFLCIYPDLMEAIFGSKDLYLVPTIKAR